MSFFPTPVIVGSDGTPAGRHALLAAVELCRATGSDLHIVHVKLASGMLRGRPMTPVQRERTDEEAYQLLEDERAAAEGAGLAVVGTHLRYGENAEQAFVSTQAELGAGLLVIGASRTGTLAQRLTSATAGSTTGTGAVRRSSASVLVVRQPPEPGSA